MSSTINRPDIIMFPKSVIPKAKLYCFPSNTTMSVFLTSKGILNVYSTIINVLILFVQVTSTLLQLDVDSQHVSEGDTMTLTCTSDEANPTSQITWYRDDVEITKGVVNGVEGGLFNSDGRISVLNLTANRKNNDVSYRCEVGGTELEDNHVMKVGCK